MNLRNLGSATVSQKGTSNQRLESKNASVATWVNEEYLPNMWDALGLITAWEKQKHTQGTLLAK